MINESIDDSCHLVYERYGGVEQIEDFVQKWYGILESGGDVQATRTSQLCINEKVVIANGSETHRWPLGLNAASS